MRRIGSIAALAIAVLFVGSWLVAQTVPSSGGALLPTAIARVGGLYLKNILFTSVAPTISSGFGTTPSIASSNGNATFRINVGTGGSASSGVVGLPIAANGWNCVVANPAVSFESTQNFTKASTNTLSTVTLTNYNTNGVAAGWPASTILTVTCSGY